MTFKPDLIECPITDEEFLEFLEDRFGHVPLEQEDVRKIKQRYWILETAIREGLIERWKLEGDVFEVGAFLGHSTDALRLYGREITSVNLMNDESPLGYPIITREAIDYLEGYVRNNSLDALVAFDLSDIMDGSEMIPNFLPSLLACAHYKLRKEGSMLVTTGLLGKLMLERMAPDFQFRPLNEYNFPGLDYKILTAEVNKE
ncbi:hypothetical protein ACFLZX_04260 [Nanoarchaeota archaeon]